MPRLERLVAVGVLRDASTLMVACDCFAPNRVGVRVGTGPLSELRAHKLVEAIKDVGARMVALRAELTTKVLRSTSRWPPE